MDEFGKEFAVPDAAIAEAGLIDQSWHNDISPSFAYPNDDEAKLSLWVDHPDPEQRETGPQGKRFMVCQYYPDSTEPMRQMDTDDLQEALKKMAEWRRETDNKRRFMFILPCNCEQCTDLPDLTADGRLILWDRQEKAKVFEVANAYANAICLEHRDHGMPFTELEKWFNGLSDESLVSEGMTATKPEFKLEGSAQ